MEQPQPGEAFERALDYLYSFFNFEQPAEDRYATAKIDIFRPRQLLARLGDPQNRYPAIHIAGTKGKGSVAAMCAFSLRAAGYRVGLYTSPHLQEFRERIRILTPDDFDGRISPAAFVHHIEQLKPAVAATPGTTWFEILTAVAFLHFAQEQIDVAVLEVGMGGRLDATNVVTPLVSVITSLSLDHMKYLGDTLAEIAFEKGGIIKPGVPVVSASQQPEALAVLQQLAAERQAPLSVIGQNWQYAGHTAPSSANEQTLTITHSPDPAFVPDGTIFPLALSGEFQLENATLALAALQVARPSFPHLTLDACRAGLAGVVWPGRLQILHQSPDAPTLLADCAHNPDSAQKLSYELRRHCRYGRLWFIFGSARDKDFRQELSLLLPTASGMITTTVNHPRSATPEELATLAEELGTNAYPAADMDTAVTLAWSLAAPGDLICVTGSIYIVGDLLNRWESLKSQLISPVSFRTESAE
ncbi:MAG: bifunctional folylpolyglutamate synthase/dihydrofolate synthase [Anaerolineae bacterium]|nr:bifunctional folylpolyglutamate synthase/dihydrofolate synthase [Anaerolineae bacterium]